MEPLQAFLRKGFYLIEGWLDRVFTPAWNPFYHFGALGFFYYWIVAATGFYLYIFFDTSTSAAYESVEYLTVDQWYLGGVMRSLHRYASDGLVLMMIVHVTREFAFGRFRGAHWFTWVTGVPILWFVIASGITGYWLVWDELAQYIAQRSTEWLDWLPIFGEPVARNFISPSSLDDRFFTLMVFLHIAVPLFLLLALWIHLNRVTRPRINPPRGLAVGTFVMMLALSLIKPAVSHGPADLSTIPTELNLDWYYLAFFPLMDVTSPGAVWGAATVLTGLLVVMPFLPPMRKAKPAVVDLANCNGCTRCEEDCPYAAIVMSPRTDGQPYDREAVVNAARCVSCGICAGACPTATPFRRGDNFVPGIDLPDPSLVSLRDRLEEASAALTGTPRVLVVGCDHAVAVRRLGNERIATLSLPCTGMLPPSFIDFALSRDFADGVFVTGCRHGECQNRLGVRWTEERLSGTRDPALRKRVPRDRLAIGWAAPTEQDSLERQVAAFADRLAALPTTSPPTLPKVGAVETPVRDPAGAPGDD